MSGKLIIVPTPIGNLTDISQRAIDVLNQVDLIAAEDTRHSARLLNEYGIKTKTISLHDHNEAQRSQYLIEKINSGLNIALVSDAGTPLISDPGYTLVSKCRDASIEVSALPGPCAFVTALSASGLPTDKFAFYGFLPHKTNAKLKQLEQLPEGATAIFYEAPRRIVDTLKVCQQALPDLHKIVLAKELTKHFENYVVGNADEVLNWLAEDEAHQKGEFVLMIYCKAQENDALPKEATNLMMRLVSHLPPKQAASIVSDHYSVNKKSLYQFALDNK